MHFNRLGPRLYLSFGILSLIMLVGSSMLIYELKQLKSNTDRLIESDFAQYQAIEKITLGIIQVQQWLTDISATRGLDGLDDGFDQAGEYAQLVRTNIKNITAMDPQNAAQYQTLLGHFEVFYTAGQQMANTYINEGPSGGNQFMGNFDRASETLQQSFEPVKHRVKQYMVENLTSEKQSIDLTGSVTMIASILIFSLLLVSGYMIKTTLSRLNRIKDSMLDISEGNAGLDAHIPIDTQDETAVIGSAFNQFVEKIKGMVDEIINVSEQLSTSNEHAQAITVSTSESLATVANSVEVLANNIGNMSQLTGNVQGSIESTTQQIQTVADQSNAGRAVIHSSNQQIEELAREVNQVNNTVSELNQHNVAISNVVTMIASIAEQTNLLALNAAIEAARAGEHGRGFAVVADEVRHLSSSTTQATLDIQKLIDAVQTNSAQALEQVEKSSKVATLSLEKSKAAEDAFETITSSVEEIRSHASEVSKLSNEQKNLSISVQTSIDSINKAVQQLSDTAKQNVSENSNLSQYSVLLKSIAAKLEKQNAPASHADIDYF